MSFTSRQFKLDDGSTWTVEALMKKTGWARGTCYARLTSSTKVEHIFRPVAATQTGRVYILDDGSEWTSQSLSEFLQCKRSTAGTRLSMMKGDSKRILAPVKKMVKDNELFLNDEELQNYVEKRMWYDKEGHWKLLNNMGVMK